MPFMTLQVSSPPAVCGVLLGPATEALNTVGMALPLSHNGQRRVDGTHGGLDKKALNVHDASHGLRCGQNTTELGRMHEQQHLVHPANVVPLCSTNH